jgi:hypothetical protein
LYPLRGLCQQFPQRGSVAAEPEIRVEVPACDPDMGTGLLDLIRDSRQGVGSVDDHLELVAGAGRRLARGPTARGSIERARPPDPSQAAAMV